MTCFYKVSVALNTFIMLFSLIIIIMSSIFISNYDDAEFLFSKGDFVWLLVGGIVGFLVAIMGCWGARDPVGSYNLLFCYFFFLSLNLLFFSVGFYLYRVFVLDLEAAGNGEVEDAFRAESAKEFNDLLLSVYTTCCTGCDTTDPNQADCVADFEPLFDPNPCPDNSCDFAQLCNLEQRQVNQGLDQGCYINTGVIPSYTIGDNFCIFFSDFATDDNGNDIVGPAIDNGCGGGDPQVFVEQVSEFVGKNYILIASFWGISLILLFMAWLGALFMLLCPHQYEKWNEGK